MSYVCTLRRLERRPALVVRREVPVADPAPVIMDAFRTVGESIARSGATPAGETYTRFLRVGSDDLYLEMGFTVRSAVEPAAPVEAAELPGGEVAVTLHRGRYERLPEALAALQVWIRAQGREPAGPHWETYLNGPPEVTDPELFETEVFVPLQA